MADEVEITVNSLADLQPKMKIAGTVKKIEIFGAFVDVGLDHDGLLHISQVRKEPIESLESVLQVGQELTVWVRKVDSNANRLDLTMIEPLATEWNELKIGQLRTGRVVRVESFGAFVDIGAERPGVVHVREMAAGYVKHPSDIVTLGDEVEVKVIAVNRKKRQIDLSMKALEVEDRESIGEDDEPVQTSMEYALRAAMGDAARGRGKRRKKRRRGKGDDREDMLRRTLAQHSGE